MDMMEVWWVAYACMSSMLHGSARTSHMLVAISGQLLMTVFFACLVERTNICGKVSKSS